MALGSGLAAQIGFGIESTPGTVVTPTLFTPLVSESLKLDRARLESAGIIAGRRVLDSDMWNGGNNTVSGDVQLELYDRSLGPLFRAMFGAVSTSGSDPYTHTFTPGELADDTLTVQVGRPTVSGSVIPFTYGGCTVTSWQLACATGAIATLGLSVTGSSEQAGTRSVSDGVTTNGDATVTSSTAAFTDADVGLTVSGTGVPAGATIASINSATSIELSAAATADGSSIALVIGKALATASYPSGLHPLKFNHGSITIGGSAVNVKSATVSGDNGLDTERRFIGSQWAGVPKESKLREYSGSLDVEFESLTQYRRYLAGDEFAVVLGFSVAGKSVTVTMNTRYEPGQTPAVAGMEIVQQKLPFKCIGDTDAEAITAVLVNSDATV